jgi:hypothetical protein
LKRLRYESRFWLELTFCIFKFQELSNRLSTKQKRNEEENTTFLIVLVLANSPNTLSYLIDCHWFFMLYNFWSCWSQVKVDFYVPVINYNGMCKMLCKFKLLLTCNVWRNETIWIFIAWLTWFNLHVNLT